MAKLTIDQALKQGVEAHKAGQVQEADRLYTAILKAQPKHPDANHNMGVLAVGVGKVEQALPFLKTALEANANTAQFWLSYIDTLIKLDRLADAKAVLDQAKSKGAKGDGFDKLEQRFLGAAQAPLEANQISSEPQPKQPNILNTLKLDQALKLANKKAKEGSSKEAKRIYQDILTKFSKNKRAIDGLKGLTGKTGGIVSKGQEPPQAQLQSLVNLYSQGQHQLALKNFETLVLQFPQSAILFNIHGAALKGLGQLELSVNAYKKALAIKPNYAEAFYNMGNALKEQGKLEEAIEAYNKALAIKPDYAEAYNNMGVVLKEQGKLEEAIEVYNKAIAIKPDYAEAYSNMSFAKLLTSSWRGGIELRKWRWHTQKHQIYSRSFSAREWDGNEAAHNKTLLVWAEQGPGDVVIWSSCISHYANIFRKIIIECHPKLVDLLGRSFPNVLVRSSEDNSSGSSQDFDFQVPMETLFGYACLAGACTETQSSYLFTDPKRVKYWSTKLRDISSRKAVGLSWKSPVMTPQRAKNYPELSHWGKTLQKYKSKFTFVNLQSTDYRDDIAYFKDHFGCEIVHFDQLDLYNDLSNVAALSQALDCSISVATAAANISAAVGTQTIIPTWKQSSWNNILFNSRGPAVDILLKNTSDSWAPVFEDVETKLKVLNAEY